MALAQGAGKALDFDGTNDYVSVADAASLDITDAITIEAWVKPSSHSDYSHILYKSGVSYGYGFNSSGYPMFWGNIKTVSNAGFEDGGADPTGWNGYHAIGDKRTTSQHYTGSAAGRLEDTSGAGSGSLISPAISFEAGKTYKISWWYKPTGGITTVRMHVHDDIIWIDLDPGSDKMHTGLTPDVWQEVVFYYTCSNNKYDYLYICNGPCSVTGTVYFDDVSVKEVVTGTELIPTGTFTHISVTFDDSANEVKFYKNGVLDVTRSVTSSLGTDDENLLIGKSISKHYFDGTMDEVRIWNDVRIEAEIRANMCKELVGDETGLVGYWRFDESSGTSCTDSSPNSNTGTMTNMDDADHVWSGAALGDASAYDYTGAAFGDFTANLTHTDGDDITATGDGGTVTGIQVYRVDATSMRTDATKPTNWTMDPLRYWGVFAVGTSPTYTVTYNYDGHPGITDQSDLALAYRENHSDDSWADLGATLDTGANTLTKTLQSGTEYALGSKTGQNTLPVVLSFFTAQFLNGVPTLYWKTMSETDNIGWFIYRNTEKDFGTSERITDYLIEGHGTTSEPHYYIYEDVELDGIPGETYWYWIESVDLGGAFHRYEPEIVIIQGTPEHYEIPEIPKQYGLHQNEPNPLSIRNSSTKISFLLHNTARVELKIYNIRGELVKDLYKGIAYGDDEVGIPWDGKDENGVVQGTGIYLYQLRVNGKTYEMKRLILLR